MSTSAVVNYQWIPNYRSYWSSDGYPDTVITEEIIPMLETYIRDKEEFYKELLSYDLVPSDNGVYVNYDFSVRTNDYQTFVIYVSGEYCSSFKISIIPSKKEGTIIVEEDVTQDDEELYDKLKSMVEESGYSVEIKKVKYVTFNESELP